MKNKKTFNTPDLTVSELSHALYETSLELNKSNEELRQANEQLVQNAEERANFYANVSHDLRAPITAISNYTEFLLSQFSITSDQKQEFNLTVDELQQSLSLILNRTNQMKYLINDFFLLSTLELPEQRLNVEPVNIGFYLEDYFYMCEADSFYAHTNLKLEIPEQFDFTLMLDPNLMHNVLDNLFVNAVKYSESPASITLGAYCIPSETSNTIGIFVKDEGIGIPKEALPYVFTPSYRVDTARTPAKKIGNGLGLTIVKRIIEKHKGTITCSSTPGEGTCFTILLPVDAL